MALLAKQLVNFVVCDFADLNNAININDLEFQLINNVYDAKVSMC